MSRCAEDAPLLLLVDDAHDLERPSLEALVFAARRLVTDPVAPLAAGRPAPVADGPLAALPSLELSGLDLDDATRLLAGRAGGPALPEVVRRLHRATAGNPLALLELASDTEVLEGISPEVPVPVPDVLARSFGRRVAQLDEDARTVVLLAALSGGDLAVVTEAATALGIDTAGLAAAQDAGLVTVSAGSVQFRHPLVRSSVYAAAPTRARRAAHQAVAASLPVTDLERRTWHLAEAAVGFDDPLADDLDRMAQQAHDRRAFAVAATAQERAAVLSSDRARRATRLVRAGELAWWAGQAQRALHLLDRGATAADDAHLRAEADALRGSIEAHTGSLESAVATLVDAARRVSDAHPDSAARWLADALQTCFWMADVPRALEIADELELLAVRRPLSVDCQVLADLSRGMADVLAGRSGIGAIRRAMTQLGDSATWPDDPLRIQLCLIGVLFMRERGSRGLLRRIEADLRDKAALVTLPGLLLLTARDEATGDDWQSAETRYEESIALARETGQRTQLTVGLAGLAWLRARTGDEDSCRELAAEALALAEGNHVHTATLWSHCALGDLELGLGRVEPALRHYERLALLLQQLSVLDVDLVPAPELVECLLRTDRWEEARRRAEDYRGRAEAKGQPWARARAKRALAMVSDLEEAQRHFDAALEMHRLNPDLFEEARTQLAYAAMLRRNRRRVSARPLLRAAIEAFEQVGAAPWAQQATQELAATGETLARRGGSPVTRLTGQELQISRMLVSGRTTKETAAALFLSPKTVEYHLRHVYTKLDIHSRAELAIFLHDPPG